MSDLFIFLMIPVYCFVIVLVLALPLSLLFTSPLSSIVHTAWERARQEEMRITLMPAKDRFWYFLFWRQKLKWSLPIIGLFTGLGTAIWIIVEINEHDATTWIILWGSWFAFCYLFILFGSISCPHKYLNKLLWYKLRVFVAQVIFSSSLLTCFAYIIYSVDYVVDDERVFFTFLFLWMLISSLIYMVFGLRKFRNSLSLLDLPNE